MITAQPYCSLTKGGVFWGGGLAGQGDGGTVVQVGFWGSSPGKEREKGTRDKEEDLPLRKLSKESSAPDLVGGNFQTLRKKSEDRLVDFLRGGILGSQEKIRLVREDHDNCVSLLPNR